MELKLIQKQFIDSELPPKAVGAIAELIDLKTDDNMKEVIAEIRGMRNEMDAKFDSMNAKFDSIDSKFGVMDMRLKTLYWVIGTIGVALFTALLIKY